MWLGVWVYVFVGCVDVCVVEFVGVRMVGWLIGFCGWWSGVWLGGSG